MIAARRLLDALGTARQAVISAQTEVKVAGPVYHGCQMATSAIDALVHLITGSPRYFHAQGTFKEPKIGLANLTYNIRRFIWLRTTDARRIGSYDHEALACDRGDQSFDMAVLPRGSRRYWTVANAPPYQFRL